MNKVLRDQPECLKFPFILTLHARTSELCLINFISFLLDIVYNSLVLILKKLSLLV